MEVFVIMKNGTKHIIIALINAILVLVIGYWIGNISSPLGDEIPYLVKHVGMKNSHKEQALLGSESYLFVNTCYDIDTIPHFTQGVQDGYRAITKRADLFSFLRHLKKSDNYKYVFIDIRLDELPKGYNSITDSIVDIIKSMERVVIAQSSTFILADSSLLNKTGGVDYFVNEIGNGFFKFPIIQGDLPSMPLLAYQDIHNRIVKPYLGGLFYMDGWRLCRKTIIPTLSLNPQGISPNNENKKCWSYVNLDDVSEISLNKLYQDKIIVIGDLFLHDIHDTYVGKMSGAVINANIYANIENKKHFIRGVDVLVLGTFYVILFLLMILSNTYNRKDANKENFWHSDIFILLLSFCGVGIVVNLLAYFIFIINGNIINVWFPILWFTIVPKIYLALNHKKV